MKITKKRNKYSFQNGGSKINYTSKYNKEKKEVTDRKKAKAAKTPFNTSHPVKKFFKGVYNLPKNIYAGVGAVKDVTYHGLKRGAYAVNPFSGVGTKYLSKKLDTSSKNFEDKFSRIPEQASGFDMKKLNPFEISKTILEAQQEIKKLRKGNTLNEAKRTDIEKQKKIIEEQLVLKQEIAKLATDPSTNEKSKALLLNALGKSDMYDNKLEKSLRSAKEIFKTSYSQTKNALGQHTLKTMGSTLLGIVPVYKRAYNAVTQGKRFEAAKLKIGRFGRESGRAIGNTVASLWRSPKKQQSILAKRLAENTLSIKKTMKNTQQVLKNIETLSKDLESLKDLTDSVSLLRKDKITTKISEQNRLLRALKTKGERDKALVEQSGNKFKEIINTTSDKQKTLIEESKALLSDNSSDNTKIKMDTIISSIKSTSKTSDDFTNITSLLEKIKTSTKDDDKPSKKEIDGAFTDITKIWKNLQEKILNPKTKLSYDDLQDLKAQQEVVVKQGKILKQLKKLTDVTQNSVILKTRAENISKTIGSTLSKAKIIKGNSSSILTSLPKQIIGTYVKSIPGFQSETSANATPNKYALNAAIKSFESAETKQLMGDKTTYTGKDDVLKTLSRSDPNFGNIFNKYKNLKMSEEEKIKAVKQHYEDNAKKYKTEEEKTKDIKKITEMKIKANVALGEINSEFVKSKQELVSFKNQEQTLKKNYDKLNEPIEIFKTDIKNTKHKIEENKTELLQKNNEFDSNEKKIEKNLQNIADLDKKIRDAELSGQTTVDLSNKLDKLKANKESLEETKASLENNINDLNEAIPTLENNLKDFEIKKKIAEDELKINPVVTNYTSKIEEIKTKQAEALKHSNEIQIREEKLNKLNRLLEVAEKKAVTAIPASKLKEYLNSIPSTTQAIPSIIAQQNPYSV